MNTSEDENRDSSPASVKTAVVYCLHGKTVWRLRRSIASLRRSGVTSDIVLLSLGGDTVDDEYVLSQCKCVVPVDRLLGDLGFHGRGWNRPWGYGSLSPMAMPLVPELDRYDRALLVESDVLALGPKFAQWLYWPTRGFEVVGATGDLHTVSVVGRSDDVEIDRCFAEEHKAREMQERIWSRNPPYTRTHINPGVCLWDLALLRSDLEWYRTRLQWFWDAELHGWCTYLLESFVNVFLDSAALLDVSMHEKTGGLESKFVQPAAHHYNMCAYTDDPNNAFNVKARELGLDADIARAIASKAKEPSHGLCGADTTGDRI